MGGLGNQMFQYAAGRALSIRNSAQLHLDTTSGFIRDKVYRRNFELGVLPINAQRADLLKQAPFWFERARNKILGGERATIQERPWGSFIFETTTKYLRDVANYHSAGNSWIEGYWQCEKYFSDVKDIIGDELTPPAPKEPQFLEIAKTMASCNSVAVGVRLFEEVPGATKAGVGGQTPMTFYDIAARKIADELRDPVFFVFCTTQAPRLQEMKLPGKVYYITHDNGFQGAMARLWLISQCSHHIVSNSSFYWWGAWLAEHKRPNTKVIASTLFQNQDTVPKRWLALNC